MLRRVVAATLLIALTVWALSRTNNQRQQRAQPHHQEDEARSPPVEFRAPAPLVPAAESSATFLVPTHAGGPAPSSATQLVSASVPVAWPHGAPCGSGEAAEKASARERVRMAFKRTTGPRGNASLYFDPAAPDQTVELLLHALARIQELINARLGLSSEPPDVYLYRSPVELREGVCVTPQTVSYYDGAIHLAIMPVGDLLGSLKHEYTHHALFTHAIRRPAWFQEGAAMLIGGEDSWSHWRPKGTLLRPAQMVEPLPRAASVEMAEAFYGQAYAMTVFLGRLCENTTSCDLRDLTRALYTGGVRPENLFDWAISQRGGDLVRTSRLPLWDDYAGNGMKFGAETAATIRTRR